MNADARAKALRKIKADRLRRKGKPEPAESRVIAEVVATQRLAGIDAREWAKKRFDQARQDALADPSTRSVLAALGDKKEKTE